VGLPFGTIDLKHLIVACLDGCGRTARSVDKMPGKDFISRFLKHHREFTVRNANLIKLIMTMLSVMNRQI
jgi:hypothetical protein